MNRKFLLYHLHSELIIDFDSITSSIADCLRFLDLLRSLYFFSPLFSGFSLDTPFFLWQTGELALYIGGRLFGNTIYLIGFCSILTYPFPLLLLFGIIKGFGSAGLKLTPEFNSS